MALAVDGFSQVCGLSEIETLVFPVQPVYLNGSGHEIAILRLQFSCTKKWNSNLEQTVVTFGRFSRIAAVTSSLQSKKIDSFFFSFWRKSNLSKKVCQSRYQQLISSKKINSSIFFSFFSDGSGELRIVSDLKSICDKDLFSLCKVPIASKQSVDLTTTF